MGKHVNKRPGIRTPEIDKRILQGLRKGIPLFKLCQEKGMPSTSTVDRWKQKSRVFAGRIARARAQGYDHIAHDCLDIADDGSRDYKELANGQVVPDYDHIQRSKLRIWTRFELLKKWDPARYGELLKLGDPTGAALVPPRLKIGLVGAPSRTLKTKPKVKRATRKS